MNVQRNTGNIKKRMMFKVKLHPEVVKFLDESGTVWMEDEIKSYVVNTAWYRPTNEEGIYTVQFLKPMYPE